MFEKEAEEYVDLSGNRNYTERAFKDGATFGYNKANEWNTETPSSDIGNKDLLLQVAKDDFDVGYYHIEKKRFYTNDGREVTPLAWKVIVPPERKPEVEG